MAGFNADANGIKTSLIAAVAAAAGVPISAVSIISVNPHTSGRRRLFSSSASKEEELARVHMLIDGVHPMLRAQDIAPLLRRHLG